MSLREEQVALTRRTIIDAVIELTADPDGGPITVPEVSRRSGVSPATIYRHFPNREALVSAAALERVESWVPPDPEGTPESQFRHYLLSLWADQAANLALARQATVSESGRELRAVRFERYQPVLERTLRDAGLDPGEEEVRHMAACVDVLVSAHAFLDLHDRQRLGVEAAVDAVMWGTRQLLESVGLSFDVIPLPGGTFEG